jgi:pyruvate dehydrogenase E2 component (dihydrolipoamide acetyltransferase)
MTIFKLPDLGEGLPDAEIHEWHVQVGDEVKIDQLLVSMETAKAVVDVPSPCNGRITKLYGNAGDIIHTGMPLIEFESDVPVKTATEAAAPPRTSAATVAGSIQVGNTVINEAAAGLTASQSSAGQVKTLPVIRVLAQKLGLDLKQLSATHPLGHITLDDVCQAIRQRFSPHTAAPAVAKPNLSAQMQPLRGVRKAMALSMAESHAQVVPVTLCDDADIAAWGKDSDFTTRLIRAICVACNEEPIMNAHFDGYTPAIDVRQDINLGIAVDSPDGLFVPVIKDAAKQSQAELRLTVNRFKEQIKTRSIPPADLRDATICLSNFGTFAGRYANPIIVPPMVTIIGAGRGRDEVVSANGTMAIHRIIPLSVTFDHRAATGGEASRFLRALIDDLEKPN